MGGWGEDKGHSGGSALARVHVLGHLTVNLTLREAAALHIAGRIVRAATPDGGGSSLGNGIDALQRALEAKGAVLDDIGWRA
jgi:hypothetical protein